MSTTQPVAAFTQLRVVIPVEAQPGAVSGEQNTVTVSGGESSSGEELFARASVERAITVGDQATPFGLERYELTPEEEDGSADVQAGSHPFQLTTTLDLNEALAPEGEGQALLEPSAPALARNLNFELPPGLLGDPQAVAQCSDADFSSIGENDVNSCPADSAIGVALVTLNLPNPPLGVFTEAVPVFNLVPAPGEPARFGLEDTKVPIILDTSVRTDGDYGVNVSIKNTTQLAQLLSSQVVLWGEPQNPAHDGSRGWACIRGKEVNGETCTPPGQRTSTPFLTLPTACLGGLDTQMNGQAWSGAITETGYAFQNGLGEPLASLEGCAAVPFDPSIAVQPVGEGEGQAGAASVSSASTPTGLNVDVNLPAEADGLGESAVRSTTVTLPAGVQLNPSAANGLQACSEAQIGYQGAGASSDPFSPGAGEPLRFSAAPASCPDASKVGVVRIKSPDLAHELEGGVYIAEQEHNPFGSLFALYIVAEDPVSGVRVKLAGEVSLNEETGQATSTFADTPQVPFEHLSLRFFEGPRASLSTPPLCGTYTTLASFTPWSQPTPADPRNELSDHHRPRRESLHQLRTVPAGHAGRLGEQPGRRVHLLHADARTSRRRPGAARDQPAAAAGNRRDPGLGHPLPRTPSSRTALRPAKPDRQLHRRRRPRQRTGRAARNRLSDRPLRGRAVRDRGRHARRSPARSTSAWSPCARASTSTHTPHRSPSPATRSPPSSKASPPRSKHSTSPSTAPTSSSTQPTAPR